MSEHHWKQRNKPVEKYLKDISGCRWRKIAGSIINKCFIRKRLDPDPAEKVFTYSISLKDKPFAYNKKKPCC